MLDGVTFEMVQITSVGDTDRTIDLRESPADFFTREVDASLLRGVIDLAVHSAKDLPCPLPAGIDWFWLPWRAEPRDVFVLSKGRKISDLPDNPVIGVSSDRREAYCTQRFPGGIQKNIRGNIEERIAQVDDGTYDIVVMAAAALVRLGIEERITEWIELDELEVPEGQGHLAITFREGDERMTALRSLFTQAVVFAGTGVGNKELCTVATLNALNRCDICLYDSLIDHSLLEELPSHAQAIDVGKRCGAHSKQQHEATRLLCECACQCKRVVRLKGGDPGIFGRLAEEIEALEKLGIPFRIIPGISAFLAATTYSYKTDLGALRGKKILLTCSEALQNKAAAHVRDLGGHPIPFPLIRLQRRRSFQLRLAAFEWVVITSPSSVRALMQLITDQNIDLHTIPKIMVCGRGTADEFEQYGLHVDAQPTSGFSADALIELAAEVLNPGEKVLRLRSDKAGPQLAEALCETGAEIEDVILYDNIRIDHAEFPEFDAVFFASTSAVESFIDQWGADSLTDKTIAVIGTPTAQALEKQNLAPDIFAREATIPGAIASLAEHFVSQGIQA